MPGRAILALLCAAIHASAVMLRADNISTQPASKNWDLVIKKAMMIPGWMAKSDAAITVAIASLQRVHGVAGVTGEIGVHFGKYFSVLATTALDDERLFACDLFEDQNKNVDHSGGGGLTISKFYLNVKKAVDVDVKHDPRVKLVSNSSLTLPERTDMPDDFKLLSIDGGHMEVITFSDLRWAIPRLRPGGVISIDDVMNPDWRGVDRGLRDFFHLVDPQYKQVRPLFMACNKLFITTTSHHDLYVRHLAEMFAEGKGKNATRLAGTGRLRGLLSGLSLSSIGAVRFASINDFSAVLQQSDPLPCDLSRGSRRSSPPAGLPMIEASGVPFKLAVLSCQDKGFQHAGAAALFNRSEPSL